MKQKEVLKILYENTKMKYGEMTGERNIKHYEEQALIYKLNQFLNSKQDKDDDFMLMINKIVSDDFNISNYYLYKNPCPEVYCFRNMNNTEGFDLHYFYDKYVYVYSSYIDKNNKMQDTNTIQEAVNKYCKDNLL